ncbi:MAG: hypothetical protein ILNGONEN_00813 [Syntrophorhabdaceae bacterium]|nr:hypothetical protein [Syntrophorhabdaceae bacterium]
MDGATELVQRQSRHAGRVGLWNNRILAGRQRAAPSRLPVCRNRRDESLHASGFSGRRLFKKSRRRLADDPRRAEFVALY